MNTSELLTEHQRVSRGAVVRHRNEVSAEFSKAALVPSNISIKHGHMFPCHLQKKGKGTMTEKKECTRMELICFKTFPFFYKTAWQQAQY